MEQFRAFEDPALEGRLKRSRRAEQDLQERVLTRISQVEADGRWLRSDPLYQRLSSILKKVQVDMREIEHELIRRGAASPPRALA